MDILKEKYLGLVRLYSEYEVQIRMLQQQAFEDIIPDVALQLDLNDDELEWIKDYLQDFGTIFRIFRRQKFIISFTYEALRDAILWRLQTLKPAVSLAMAHVTDDHRSRHVPGLSALLCLPLEYRDKFGRPLAILRVSGLNLSSDPEELRRGIMLSMEQMRVLLQKASAGITLNGIENFEKVKDNIPTLQYAIVLDLTDVSMKNISIDLVNWYSHDIHPWYPGVMGAAFIINYSWAHSGLWRILKHVLPASAITKIIFPTDDELPQFFSEASLSYILRMLESEDDNLTPHSMYSHPVTRPTTTTTPSMPLATPISTLQSTLPQLPPPSRFSLTVNPFFGYPVTFIPPSATSSMSNDASYSRPYVHHHPRLRHGRRRTRDLVRTLLHLYWQRWHHYIFFLLPALILLSPVRSSISTILRRAFYYCRSNVHAPYLSFFPQVKMQLGNFVTTLLALMGYLLRQN